MKFSPSTAASAFPISVIGHVLSRRIPVVSVNDLACIVSGICDRKMRSIATRSRQVPENQVCRRGKVVSNALTNSRKYKLIERGENRACINGVDRSDGAISRTGTRVSMRFSRLARTSRSKA